MKLEFSRQIFENIQISNIMKILPVGAELLHAEWQTDKTKLTVAILRTSLITQYLVKYGYNSIR
jgi:hypothetical protein